MFYQNSCSVLVLLFGALTREAEHAESKADFIHKLSISLKEANDYWIELLFQTDFLSENEYKTIKADVEELIKLLVAIIKTSKTRK